MSDSVHGRVRASQLGEMQLHCFRVEPARLIGLISVVEQRLLDCAAAGEATCLRFLAPNEPVALRLHAMCAERKDEDVAFRVQLLGLFFEAFGQDLKRQASAVESRADARERLLEFLRETPASELLNLNFSDLAERTCCTPRHLSRIFHELVGSSFRDRQAELRLARSLELLAATDAKVVDVALESGYQSVSLFNLMFKRRFGISPGRWRQKRKSQDRKIRVVRRASNIVALANA
jgi:AraC-like DNA-binding protein